MSKLNYEHDYCHAGMTGMEADTVPEVLGKAEGRDEWEDSPESADANFINIKSYKMFTESDYVFLVGRIGSGKTAMLNKLKYSIDTGKCKTYSCASMIDTENYVGQLGKSIRLSEDSTLSYNEMMILAKNAWRKTINTIAMNAMYEAYSQFGSERFKHIKDYLEEEGILSSHITAADIISKLCDRLSSIDNAYIQGTTAAVSALSSIFHSTEKYNNALVELAKITKRYNKPLILIDSIELYEYSDRIVLAVLNALATVCMESTKKTSCVYIKMAAPSELIPKLIINFEKLTSKTIYIRWSYCDLKEFIAVRIYRYIKKVPSNSPINSQIALDFFDEYFGPTCKTRYNLEFPTFPYCVANTQKEPRHILSIFNAWLYYDNVYQDKDRMELLSLAIDYDLWRVKGALSIYEPIHIQMFEMFQRTFTGKKYCFTEAEFDEWLKYSSGLRGNVDAYDLKKCFISSGLVGIMLEMHEIMAGNSTFKNKQNIRIKEVIFEYQQKENLPFNQDTKFCLHPMAFRVLNTIYDKNTFVYPKPAEDEYTPWKELS